MLKIFFIGLIKLYQRSLSPMLGQNCKYYPSCSLYFIQAIEKNGLFGFFQGLFRLLRCNPFSHGGYDPVKKL